MNKVDFVMVMKPSMPLQKSGGEKAHISEGCKVPKEGCIDGER